jgi:MoaA/NifB/PqqE/SkfB family radical SAM enzyme
MAWLVRVLLVASRCLLLCRHCRRPFYEPAPLVSHALCAMPVVHVERLFNGLRSR